MFLADTKRNTTLNANLTKKRDHRLSFACKCYQSWRYLRPTHMPLLAMPLCGKATIIWDAVFSTQSVQSMLWAHKSLQMFCREFIN
ncbi:hypothetical protein PROFUN_13126 [Planoprotostelium fungivorum]|uniref:Uncharacterized protein n=1 Tax=Planoprotostelium fungivorum TaxID=1890364 RepID=A0A2P6N528_9EUKA|nr:hypothetical protein PROFUN_13126 [Planoprotostelium fungivorum]